MGSTMYMWSVLTVLLLFFFTPPSCLSHLEVRTAMFFKGKEIWGGVSVEQKSRGKMGLKKSQFLQAEHGLVNRQKKIVLLILKDERLSLSTGYATDMDLEL